MESERITPKQARFLAAFVETANVSAAAQVARVHRGTHYEWLKRHPVYAQAFDLAKQQAADLLEEEAWRRGVEGVLEPAGWYNGEPCGYVRRYSDPLLIALLKAHLPEKYGDRLAVRGSWASIDLTQLPDEALLRLSRGEHPLAVLGTIAQRQLRGGSGDG